MENAWTKSRLRTGKNHGTSSVSIPQLLTVRSSYTSFSDEGEYTNLPLERKREAQIDRLYTRGSVVKSYQASAPNDGLTKLSGGQVP